MNYHSYFPAHPYRQLNSPFKNFFKKRLTGIVFISTIFFALLTGCTTTLKVTPRSPEQSVLYVLRIDAPLSKNDKVKVFLNNKEVTMLLEDEYKALHINPGTYDIEFIVIHPDGKKETATKFSALIKPDDVKIAIIRYVLGWKDPRRFQDARNLSVFKRLIFAGEIDATGLVKPK